MALIQVYDKRTGEPVPHLVPEHWLDNPKLGGNYTRQKAAADSAVARNTNPTPVKPDTKEK